MTENKEQSKIALFLQGVLEKLSHPRLYYFLATCVILIGGLSWVVSQWQNTYLFLQKTVPLWLVLLIVCPLFMFSLIANHKNKKLQKKLEFVVETNKTFKDNAQKDIFIDYRFHQAAQAWLHVSKPLNRICAKCKVEGKFSPLALTQSQDSFICPFCDAKTPNTPTEFMTSSNNVTIVSSMMPEKKPNQKINSENKH